MVLGCKHLWIILQELWSIFYVICGSLQLLSAIFSLITLKELKLYGVLMAGGWNILMGIISGMWSCIGKYSYKTREFLLYVAISNLIINTIAIIYTEWNLYFMDIKLISNYYSNHLLIDYAIFIARIASFTVLTVAFFDTQFGFCSTQTFSKRILKRETHHHHHDGSSNSMENMSDIEYIINRSNSVKSRSNREIYDAYAQSWVFDNSANNNPPNNIVRKPKSSPTTKNPLGRTSSSSSSNENNLIIINKDEVDNNYLLENKNKLPMVNIKVEKQEEEEDEDTDRKIIHMKSFSRSASPIIKNYEYLEKITEPEIYRSRLNSALSSINNNSKIITTANNNAEEIVKRKIEEPVQYATLMKELQNVIVHKKVQSPESEIISTDDDDDDDTEFSKELEAALQLIQDLESPNNAEIPSSDPSANNNQINPLKIRNNNNNNNSLSASSSITDIMIPSSSSSKADFYHGKKKDSARILESQSTSGYSSPSHYNPNNNLNNWSTTSSLNGASRSSNNDILKSLSYHIHDAKSTTVISLYSPPIDQNSKGKSVTLVNISANNNNNPLLLIDDDSSDHHLNHDYYSQSCEDLLMKNSTTTTTPPTSWNNVKSLLRKKRIINNKPVKLCAELEGAIIKSESLAYLTDLELMARAKRNEEIQREIEEKIIQNMDRRRRSISLFEAESHC